MALQLYTLARTISNAALRYLHLFTQGTAGRV
jgi:hypothetical protein